eukprot:PhF_6_TR38618/c0_g1_i1/m.57552
MKLFTFGLLVALFVLILMVEPGHGFLNKRGYRLRKWVNKLRLPTYLKRKATRPTRYIVNGCPIVSGKVSCAANFVNKLKYNWTRTATRNTTQTLVQPTLRVYYNKFSTGAFHFVSNKSFASIDLRVETFGVVSWVMFRVQSTNPVKPAYPMTPQAVLDAVANRAPYKRSPLPGTFLQSGNFTCFPGKNMTAVNQYSYAFRQGFPVNIRTFRSCLRVLTFRNLLPGETYAFFATGNRPMGSAAANIAPKTYYTTVASYSFTMSNYGRPSWVSLTRTTAGPGAVDSISVMATTSKAATVNCYAAWPNSYKGVPTTQYPDLLAARANPVTAEVEAPHPTKVATDGISGYTNKIVARGSATTAYLTYLSSTTVQIDMQTTDSGALAAMKQGVVFDIFCAPRDTTLSLDGPVRSIQEGAKDTTAPVWNSFPTINMYPTAVQTARTGTTTGTTLAVNFTSNEAGRVWYYIAPIDFYTRPTSSFYGTVQNDGSGGIRSGFVTVRRYPNTWQGTERNEAVTAGCCYEPITVFFTVLPAMKYRIILVAEDLGTDRTEFTGQGKRSFFSPNIQAFPSTGATEPTTKGKVGTVSGLTSTGVEYIVYTLEQDSGIPKLTQFGPCTTTASSCSAFPTATYDAFTGQTLYYLRYQLSRPGYLRYSCAKLGFSMLRTATDATGLHTGPYTLIRRFLMKGLNITYSKLRNYTRQRNDQVFQDTVLYDSVAAGKSMVRVAPLIGLNGASGYYCMAEFWDITCTKALTTGCSAYRSAFNGLYDGTAPITGTLASNNARPWFVFKTRLNLPNLVFKIKPRFLSYNRLELSFTANRYSKIYYVIAPAEPNVDSLSYQRTSYPRFSAGQMRIQPKVRNMNAQEARSTSVANNADLWNTATGRALGEITDSIFDFTGNKGFKLMLHARDYNFAGIAPINTAGTIECRGVFDSTTLYPNMTVCHPIMLNNGLNISLNRTWSEGHTANNGVSPKVIVDGLDNQLPYRILSYAEDYDGNTFSSIVETFVNSTSWVKNIPQFYPTVKTRQRDLDGISVTNPWTTRATLNVTLTRAARVYWVVLKASAIPLTKYADIMYYALLGRARYVPFPTTGTAAAIDKIESNRTGLGVAEATSPNRFIFDAGVLDYFLDGVTPAGDGTFFGVNGILSYTTRSHNEKGFVNQKFFGRQTIRGLQRSSTYTVYAFPADLDPTTRFQGDLGIQNFTTKKGKACNINTRIGYTPLGVSGATYVALPDFTINENVFSSGFTWKLTLTRDLSDPSYPIGDTCSWSTILTSYNYNIISRLFRERFKPVTYQFPSRSGINRYWTQILSQLTVSVANTTTGLDFNDELTIQFPRLGAQTGEPPFDVYQKESFCFTFFPQDPLLSNQIIPVIPTGATVQVNSLCPVVAPVAATQTTRVFIKNGNDLVENTTKTIQESEIQKGLGLVTITLKDETWANRPRSKINQTFGGSYYKPGVFASQNLAASGDSASVASWNARRAVAIPFARISELNRTLTLYFNRINEFYIQGDIQVTVTPITLLTLSGIAPTTVPTFTIVAPLRFCQLVVLDSSSVASIQAANQYDDLTSQYVSSVTDVQIRNGLSTGGAILIRYRLATSPVGQDVFRSAGIQSMLAATQVSSAAVNTHGFATFRNQIINITNCSVPDSAQHVLECKLKPLVNYTINQDEVLLLNPLTPDHTPKALRSGMIFTIVGRQNLTVKKTTGYVTVSPNNITEDQVRAGISITYELVGDQFVSNPLSALEFHSYNSLNTEIDTGSMPRGFLSLNSLPSADCANPQCSFPSCRCGTQAQCSAVAGCSFSAAKGCVSSTCDVPAFYGVGGMFKSKTLDGTNNMIIDAPLSRKLTLFLYNPLYDAHQQEYLNIKVLDDAIVSNGYVPTTDLATITINPTQGQLTMAFKSPRGNTLGELSESEIREGGLTISLILNIGESFASNAAGVQCLYDAWVPTQASTDQTASFAQKKLELINSQSQITFANFSTVAIFTFAPGLTYNTKGNDLVKFDMLTYTQCFRSGIVPRFIQGGSRSSVQPQFQVNDGNALMKWNSPGEYAVGTYTAVVTEADVRSGLKLSIGLVGDIWVTTAPAPWLSSSIFKTSGVSSIAAVSAPIFSAVVASSSAISSTDSKVDSGDRSIFTIVVTPQPLYNIAATETTLISIPAATAGAGSSTVTGSFEPTFGTAQGLFLRIVAFKISASPSALVTVVGVPFDLTVKVSTSGWSAGASPDPSGSRAESPVPTIPTSQLITGYRQGVSITADPLNRLGGLVNVSGSGGTLIYSGVSFVNTSQCQEPCVIFGIKIFSFGEVLYDDTTINSTALVGGLITNIVDNWAITVPQPVTSFVAASPVPFFVTVSNGNLLPPNGYQVLGEVFAGLTKTFSAKATITGGNANFGAITVVFNASAPQDGTLELTLLTATGATVPINSRVSTPVKIVSVVKVIPAGLPNYNMIDSPRANEPFNVDFVNFKPVGRAFIIDSLNSCGSANSKQYANATISSTFSATFVVPSAGNTFPITAFVCVNGSAIGGLLTITRTVSPTFTVNTAQAKIGEVTTLTINTFSTIAPGLSFFLSDTANVCTPESAVEFSGAVPPLTSLRTDGVFSFTLGDSVTATRLFVCIRTAGSSNFTSLSNSLTVTQPDQDEFDTPLTITQFETLTLRVTSKRIAGSFIKLAFVKKSADFTSCEAFGRRSIPKSLLLQTSDDNPSARVRYSNSFLARLFSNFFDLPTVTVFSFTPTETTVAAGFCVQTSPSAGWRTLVLSSSQSSTVQVVRAPSFSLVQGTYGEIGTKLSIAFTLSKTTATTNAYITSQGHCSSPPTLTNASDAQTSGLFKGISDTATTGLVRSKDGSLTLELLGTRLPTVPSTNVRFCYSIDGVTYTQLRKEGGGFAFEVRAGPANYTSITFNNAPVCTLQAAQQKQYSIPPLTVTIYDRNNITSTSAEGYLYLSVQCYTGAGIAVNSCKLLGRTVYTVQPSHQGQIVVRNLYLTGVSFGGTFSISTQFNDLKADPLRRDTTCNGTLQFSIVGTLTFGGSILSGFNVPSATTGFRGATLTVRLADASFGFDICTSATTQAAFLNNIVSGSRTALSAGLFTFRSSGCSTSGFTLEMNASYVPRGSETWLLNITSANILQQTTPVFSGVNSFTLSSPVTASLTARNVTEYDLALLNGFSISVTLPSGSAFVDPAAFALMKTTLRSAITSNPLNRAATASTFALYATGIIPDENIVRVSDNVITIAFNPNPNYVILADDKIDVTLPAGIIVGYSRAVFAGSFFVFNMKDAVRLNATVSNTIVTAGSNFTINVVALDNNNSVVPLGDTLRVACTLPVYGDGNPLVLGRGASDFSFRTVGNATCQLSLATFVLKSDPITFTITADSSSFTGSALLAVPQKVAANMTFTVAIKVADKYGNAIADGTTFAVAIAGVTITQRASAMRRLLQVADSSSAPSLTATSLGGVVRFRNLVLTGSDGNYTLLISSAQTTYYTAKVELTSTLATFLGVFPALADSVIAGVDAELRVAVLNNGVPGANLDVSFTSLVAAGRISSNYSRKATTGPDGIARMLLQFPVPGAYTFMAVVGSQVVLSSQYDIPSGPPASIAKVYEPTPDSSTNVSPGTIFKIDLQAFDSNGNLAVGSQVGLIYNVTLPVDGSLQTAPSAAQIVNGTGSLSFSVSSAGIYVFTICMSGYPLNSTTGCVTSTVYATGATATVTVNSGNPFTDCDLVSVTATFSASIDAFPNMAVTWIILNSQGEQFPLPGGWIVGQDIPLNSENALGAQVANLADSASKAVDLSSKRATFQFTPGQIGLTQAFRIRFQIAFVANDPRPYTYMTAFEPSPLTKVPSNMAVIAPPSNGTNSRRPSVIVVDSTVYNIIRGTFTYTGCGQTTTSWTCIEYSNETDSATSSTCTWLNDDGVVSAYVPVSGAELRLAPQSLPADPAYRVYTFLVNGVEGGSVELQGQSRPFVVKMDHSDFLSTKTTGTRVTETVYCVRPPADVASKGALSYDPLAADSVCTNCIVSWYYDGSQQISNIDSFITPKGIEPASDLTKVTQPLYAVRIWSTSNDVKKLTCRITKAGQTRISEASVTVSWVDQQVPANFFLKHVRPAGMVGPHNRDDEDGLRVVAIIGDDTASLSSIPTGYTSLTYTAVSTNRDGSQSAITFTNAGVKVNQVAITTPNLVGTVSMLPSDIPANAVSVNVSATLVPSTEGLRNVAISVVVEISQPPVYVGSSDFNVVYATGSGDSVPLTITQTGTVQLGPAGQGQFSLSFPVSIFSTQYRADILSFRVLAEEMILQNGQFVSDQVSALPAVGVVSADGDYVTSTDNTSLTIVVNVPVLSNPTFRLQVCARNKYLSQSCQVFPMLFQTQDADGDAVEQVIQRTVGPIGAVGLRVDLGTFITLTNLLGKYNLDCLLKRTGVARKRCVAISKQHTFTMSQLAYNVIGNLNVRFKTRYEVLSFSLFRMSRGGSLFLTSGSINRLRSALNLFTNFALLKRIFLGTRVLTYMLGANSWLLAAGSPFASANEANVIAAVTTAERRLLAVAADIESVVADLENAQTALSTGMTIGETRTTTRDGTFMSVYRSTLASLASKSYVVGPDTASSWTVSFINNFATTYANGQATNLVVVDTRVRLYPKGMNPRAGAGTIQPYSRVFSIAMQAVSSVTLGTTTNKVIEIQLPDSITSTDGKSVPEFTGSSENINPECYRWSPTINNWVSARTASDRLKCTGDLNAGTQDFALVLPPPFAASTLACPSSVLPDQQFNCTLSPLKGGVLRESQPGTFETTATGITILNTPTGNSQRATIPLQFRAPSTEVNGTVTVSTMTAYITNMPVTVPVNALSINGSRLQCSRLIIQSGCPVQSALSGLNRTTCNTIPAMRVKCTVNVFDNSGASNYACIAGTLCRGNTLGTFSVEIRSAGQVITNNVTNIYNGGSAPTGTTPVFNGTIAPESALNADNGATAVSFIVNAPFTNSNIEVRVLIRGTSTYVVTKFGGLGWPLALRESAPDETSTITCARVSSYPRITNGKIVFMPASILTKSAGAFQLNPNVPSAAQCVSGVCSSVVRCTVTPLFQGAPLKGFAYDFEPTVSVGKDVTIGSIVGVSANGNTCDCSSFRPEDIVSCTCTTASTYYFDVTASNATIKDSNPHTLKVNINGVEATAFTHTFDVNYADVQSTFQAEIGCTPSQGSTNPNFAVSTRPVTCVGILKDVNGILQPSSPSCMSLTTVSTNGNNHFSAFGPITSTDGLSFTFTATPNEVGKCEGGSGTTCSYRLQMTTGSGGRCGTTAYTSTTNSITVEHGTPTAATTFSCLTPTGFYSNNLRIGATTTCTIAPMDSFGSITCCNGGLTQFAVALTNGGSVGSFSTTSNGRAIDYQFTAPTTVPTTNTYGVVTHTLSYASTNVATSTSNIVDYPAQQSQLACTPSEVATLQYITCIIYVKNANGNTTADPSDFYLTPVDVTSFGILSTVTPRLSSATYLNRVNTELTFTLRAGKLKGTGKNISVKSYYRSTAATTKQTNLTLLDSNYELLNSPTTHAIVYGVATTASSLDCAGSSDVEALGSVACTINVRNALGETTVDPTTRPFTTSAANGQLTTQLTADGSSFTFNATAADAALVGSKLNITATLSNSHITKSPATFNVVYRPTIASTITCAATSIKALGVFNCTIQPRNDQGLTKGTANQFSVVPSAGSVTGLQSGQNDNTLTFTYKAPAVKNSTTITLQLVVSGSQGLVSSITVNPGVPTSASTVTCVSRANNLNVEVTRTAACTITAKDADGATAVSEGTFTVAAPTQGAISALVTADNGMTYTFTYTASVTQTGAVALVTSINGGLNLPVVTINVIYGTPTSALLSCTSSIAGGKTATCTLSFNDAAGKTSADPSQLSVNASIGSITTPPSTKDVGITYSFVYTGPVEGGSALITAAIAGTTLGSVRIQVVGTPAPTNPQCSVSVSVFTTGALSSAKEVVVVASSQITGVTFKYLFTVSNHPKANAVNVESPTSPYYTIASTDVSATVTVSVVAQAAGYRDCTATTSYTTFAAPTGGLLQVNKGSLMAGGTDTIELKCSGWSTNNRGLTRYTFYMGTDVIAELSADTYVYTPPYQSIDKSVLFGCVVVNDLGMQSVRSADATVSLLKTVIAPGKESEYVSGLMTSIPTLPSGATSQSPEFAAQLSSIASASAAIDQMSLSADVKAARSAELGSKLKAAVALGQLSTSQKDQFSSLGSTLVKYLDKTNPSAFSDMYEVMKGSTTAPITQKTSDSANAYASAIFGMFNATSRKYHELQTTSGAQDIATTQGVAVLARTAQASLYSGDLIPNKKYQSSGDAYTLVGSINTAASLQSTADALNTNNVAFAFTTTGTATLGFVRITFKKNLRSYATTATDSSVPVMGFSLFDGTSFLSGSVTVQYQGKTGGSVASWDKDSKGQMRNGWSVCTGACALDNTNPPSEFAYVTSTTAAPTTAPPSTPTPATPAPTIVSTVAPSSSSSSEDLAWIAGPIIGGVVFIALVVAGIIWYKKKNEQAAGDSGNRVQDDSAEVENEHRI